MRRLLPVVAALLAFAPNAAAAPHALGVASWHEVGHPVGLMAARETPGTIRAHLMLQLDDALPSASVGLYRGGCSDSPGRHLTLTSDDFMPPGADLRLRVDTQRSRLVLPRVRSLRIVSGGEQVVCAPVVRLRKGRHPNVTLTDAAFHGPSGGLETLLLTVGGSTSCGMAMPTTEAFNYAKIEFDLLSKAGKALGNASFHLDVGETIDFAVTVLDDEAKLSIARRLRGTGDDEAIGGAPVSRFVGKGGATALCNGW